MGITGCCNKSENENTPSTPRVFKSNIFLARLLREVGVGPVHRVGGGPSQAHAGPLPWCPPRSCSLARAIGANPRGETFELRMLLGGVPTTSERIDSSSPGRGPKSTDPSFAAKHPNRECRSEKCR